MNTDFVVANEHVALLPVSAADAGFLLAVYASTRMEEMALVDWSPEQKDAFLRMQFEAQTKHYRSQYPDAEYQIIQRADGVPIGRLIIDRSSDCILLMDIALLPEFRNHGIGTAMLRDLMAEAAAANLPIRLHVEFFNPVMKLYERLGFVKCQEAGLYYLMVWQPGRVLS